MLGLVIAIYAFNLAYPKNFEKTLLFFQLIILSLDDEQPLYKNILHVTSLLNQEMES